jgi:spermine/spermidine synthase
VVSVGSRETAHAEVTDARGGLRPPFRVLFAIGLVSGCALALQVLLTRLLSAVLFYDFVFLAISLALLGTGVGGMAVFVWPRFFDRINLESALTRWSTLLALLLAFSPLALVRLDYTYNNTITAGFVIGLVLACLVTLLSFLASGIALAMAIRGYPRATGRVYAYDLIGAGAGAALVVPTMWVVSAPTGIVVLGLGSAVAAILFAGRRVVARNVAIGALAVGLLMTILCTTTGLDYLPSPYFPSVKPAADVWTPLDRVLGYAPPKGSSFGYIFYDRVYAPVPVHRPGQPYPNWRQLLTSSQSIGMAMARHGNILVIGGGGGRDIYDALSSGFRQVHVIELNTAIVNVVDNDLGSFSGRPYVAPGVHTVVGDGRAILADQTTKYDEIHIGFTDTLSGSSADAFALSEQNLYTVQSLEEYYDHLAPDGILNITRNFHLVGDEALRMTVLTLQALQDRGITRPSRNVVVILGVGQFGAEAGTVLSQLHPFTSAQLSEIRTLAAQRGDEIAYAPGGPYASAWKLLHSARTLSGFCTHYEFDVCPSTDNEPFFFNMTRLSGVFKTLPKSYVYTIQPFTLLFVTVAILLVLAMIGFFVPLGFVDRKSRPPSGSLLYFAAIGVGFLTLEITLIQRFVLFLGFPTYALSVVLCSLLIFTGIGAWLSTRWRNPRRAVMIDLAVASALIALSAYLLQPLLGHLITIPFAARVALSLVLLAPFGVTLGMAMPIGLRRVSALYPNCVPWAWGVNGFASVFGAAFGVFVAIEWGFAVATLLALACYLGALAHAAWGAWPRGDEQAQLRPSEATAGAGGVLASAHGSAGRSESP